MTSSDHNWALVLAAGDGSRLKGLTTDANGKSIPKQYCSLIGNASMLQETLLRAGRIAPRERVMVIVAAQHRPWWRSTLRDVPADNTIVQPQNRGTGNGVLLPLLTILNRDPDARVVLLPSDHFVEQERVIRHSIHRALDRLDRDDSGIVLLGISPDRFDSELGYIVPGGADRDGTSEVRLFVEKPGIELARRLGRERAVWNSFIIAARGQDLLELYAERFPDVVLAMTRALRAPGGRRERALTRLYATLPDIDFSRHLLSDATDRLRLMPVPRCGWSDLGTPDRVSQCLARVRAASELEKSLAIRRPVAFLNLADAQLQYAG